MPQYPFNLWEWATVFCHLQKTITFLTLKTNMYELHIKQCCPHKVFILPLCLENLKTVFMPIKITSVTSQSLLHTATNPNIALIFTAGKSLHTLTLPLSRTNVGLTSVYIVFFAITLHLVFIL